MKEKVLIAVLWWKWQKIKVKSRLKVFLVWFGHFLQQLYKQPDSSSHSLFLSTSFFTAGRERRSRLRIRCAGPAVSTSVAGRDFGLHLSAFGPPCRRHHVSLLVLSPSPFAPLSLPSSRPLFLISPELVTLIDVRNCRYEDMSPRIKRQ